MQHQPFPPGTSFLFPNVQGGGPCIYKLAAAAERHVRSCLAGAASQGQKRLDCDRDAPKPLHPGQVPPARPVAAPALSPERARTSLDSMLGVLLLGMLAPAGLGISGPVEPQPTGSQCVEHECFALFRGPATFLAASRACERLGGHLMTVRSSVAADVISLLLSGDSSVGPRLWIGLQLPPGCGDPGPVGPLRGFQWVTGDNRTSYSRWARLDGGAAPLCGPLCTTVSAATDAAPGEPAWEEQQCEAEAHGFLCEFHFAASCKPLVVDARAPEAAHISSTYSTPFGVRDTDFQALPVGSSASVAPLGLELECTAPSGAAEGRWTREATGAWDCSIENGGCAFSCNRSAGAPSCLCPGDAALLADGRSCGAPPVVQPCDNLCEHYCISNPDVPGSYSCMCETGYQLAADQHSCEDVDDCLQSPSPCPQRCVNTKGGFDCPCYEGYELVDGECVELVDPCFGTNCEYQCQPVSPTEYRCICSEGFAPIPEEPHRCQMFCNESACPADCDPNNPNYCECPEGFILDDGTTCVDIDECDNDYCPGECRNLPGSYECICGPDTPLAGHVGKDCHPAVVHGGDDDGGSGEPPASPTPGSTTSPPAAGPVHSGVLIGTSIASLSLVVALLALLCHLRKKQGAQRAELEYKCASPAKEVVLQRVRTDRTLQRL
uniref:thrombomodulin n=1 Tax=Jaculus jaculus TaxID=51337 RepID=UPI001E1B3941|nr:thrombomodulin [Jaculus jaculus]